jgi:hypothetical protein
MNKETITFYNLYTGTFYDVLKDDVHLLSENQIPLNKKPSSSCKKCYGRGFLGKNSVDFTYIPCSCLQKHINLNILKDILNNDKKN